MGGDGEPTETTAIVSNSTIEEVSINVRCSNGTKFSIKTKLDSTVNDFKCVLSRNCDVPANQQRLIYKGRILKDDQTLDSYGLQADHTIHMVRGFAPSAPSNPTGATVNDSATPASREPASTRRGGLGAAGARQVASPGSTFLQTPGLGGNSGSGLPGLEQMHQQMTQNPNMMREMMNMPAIQSLMNNPEIMRNLIMNNPQMREIIDRNPELAHILNDPSILRQTLETARNPELMREMMRNTDRAMSNIESSPEGFNMLRRMYENVQEPFMNATTMTGDTGNNLSSSQFAALSGNQGAGGGQHRDGSNNPSTTGSEAAIPNTNPLPNPWSRNTGSNQTNNASRTTPGDTRPSPLGGVGSLPEVDDLFGGVPDAPMMNQLMQNPAVSRMMQNLLSNPESMNEILNSSPQLRAVSDANPQIRELMQNPELLNQLASPEMMQQMLTIQQSLLSSLNRSQSNLDTSQTAGAGVAGNANNQGLDLEMMMNMFGGLGAGGLTTPENSNVPPEELYATQLTQLQEMGFLDTQENIRALQATRGNVHAAVERLLGNMGQ